MVVPAFAFRLVLGVGEVVIDSPDQGSAESTVLTARSFFCFFDCKLPVSAVTIDLTPKLSYARFNTVDCKVWYNMLK